MGATIAPGSAFDFGANGGSLRAQLGAISGGNIVIGAIPEPAAWCSSASDSYLAATVEAPEVVSKAAAV